MAFAFSPLAHAMAPVSSSPRVFFSSPPAEFWWQPSFLAVPSHPPVDFSSQLHVSNSIPAISPVPSPSQAPASLPATSMLLVPAEAPLSSLSSPSPPPSSLSPTNLSPLPTSISSLKPPELSPFIPTISPLLPPSPSKLPIDSPSNSSLSPLSAPNPSLNSPLSSPPPTMSTRNSPPPSPSPKHPVISDSPPQSAHTEPVLSPSGSKLPPPIVSLPPAILPSNSPSKAPPSIHKNIPPPHFSASPSSSPHPKPLPSFIPPMARHSNHSAAESSGNGVNKTVLATTLSVTAGLLALFFLAIIWVLMKRLRRTFANSADNNTSQSPPGSSAKSDTPIVKAIDSLAVERNDSIIDFMYIPPNPGSLRNSRSLFAYEQLWRATNGFSDQNFLGEGGFGSVYKGCLQDGREVAVKHLKIGGGQGEREFKAEVEIISRVHHRHLVTLVGFCISENKRLLIYDYVPNNNLYFHLHEKNMPGLDWATRVKVAAGAARGIAYLHEGCHPRIIHRDIKSSNILLDNSFDAQVSDFGLAKLALDTNSHVSTRVVGTFGYMAPEYASSGKLTEKSDVYSFGVVLLELITGRKPVDSSQSSGAESLVEWARPLLVHALESKEFENLVDPRLGNNYVHSEMLRMIEAAAACVRHLAAKRPQMGQIVRAIDDITSSDLTNGMRLGESELYDSAFHSAEIGIIQRMAFGNQNYTIDFL